MQSAAISILCTYLSSMQKHGILDDGQTETCAAHLSAAAFIDTIEAFKDAVQMFC